MMFKISSHAHKNKLLVPTGALCIIDHATNKQVQLYQVGLGSGLFGIEYNDKSNRRQVWETWEICV